MMKFLEDLGIHSLNSGVYAGKWIDNPGGKILSSMNPTNGEVIAQIIMGSEKDYELAVQIAEEAFLKWRMMPAPKRGEVIRLIGNQLRRYKSELGKLVSLEMGKILAEGEGEVQEMIDVADFAVGLSRQLCGITMHSERELHRMYEQWHPLGVIGLITAFNFPVSVWSWNALIAGVAGDSMIWKPSSKTALCAIAVQKIINPVLEDHKLNGIMNLVIGSGADIGEKLIQDKRIPLISATGSTNMGKRVGEVVGARLGKTILELGGNNAIILMEDAHLDLAVRAIVFGAVGTAGQRCTSTRRIIVQNSVKDKLIEQLKAAYSQISIGDPLDSNNLMGPLIDKAAVDTMMDCVEIIKNQGGEILYGGNVLSGDIYDKGCFVEPSIVLAHKDMQIIHEETFAPILYIIPFDTLDEAVAIHNDVPQGLSSAMFSTNILNSERFLSHKGSDCGIANINIGTSGAEIGGAFGGEKETGGGRESGSDAWKAYMRRQTVTINWSTDLPLSQGIHFGDAG